MTDIPLTFHRPSADFPRPSIRYGFDAFDKLLAAHYYKAEHLAVDFEACETAMRRHIVSGMLTLSQRQQRFEEHQARLRERLA